LAIEYFLPFPSFPDNLFVGFVAEIIATAILMFGILLIIKKCARDTTGLASALASAILFIGIALALGGMHNNAMNPARDFSPRVFMTIVGFKHNGLTDGTLIWLAPFFGSFIGAIIGTFSFKSCIGFNNEE
jgi:glycerol uptake facilitator protein